VAEVAEQLEELFRDLPTAEELHGEPERFMIAPSARAGGWDVSGPAVNGLNGLPLASAITLVMTGVNLAALEAEPERLHLHAAGAVREGRAVVMSAPRETGKTTTLARLVLRGWEYISDEAVSIGPGDDEVRGFAKPLSIKAGGSHLVSELLPHLLPAAPEEGDDQVRHVALGATGATTSRGAPPRLIVLLRRPRGVPDGAAPRAAPIHPVDAVVRLMGETMDAGRFGPRAVVELARLAARCRCHEVHIGVGDPEGTADLIERLFDDAAVEPLPVEELEDGAAINPNLVTLLIGDRVVMHEQPEGRIIALDSAASQIWLTLGGWPATQEVDLEGPVVAPFVAQLAALGLLRDGEAGHTAGGAGS
jgi:hypothetical protein